jgi:F-type H+-transporting ATPase subunit a
MAENKSAISEHLEHLTANIGGFTVNVDTIIVTWVIAALLIIIALIVRSKLTSGTPGILQNIIEMVYEFINGLVKQNVTFNNAIVAPLAITLFIFILMANWLGLIPLSPAFEKWESPTADLNLPAAMALVVFLVVHFYGLKVKGPAYLAEFVLHPFPVSFKFSSAAMMPLQLIGNLLLIIANIVLRTIEELSKPISLAMRLFGNIFAGGIIAVLIVSLIPWYLSWSLGGVWLAFHLFVGLIQAFVFTMLTIVYLAIATQKLDESH